LLLNKQDLPEYNLQPMQQLQQYPSDQKICYTTPDRVGQAVVEEPPAALYIEEAGSETLDTETNLISWITEEGLIAAEPQAFVPGTESSRLSYY
jgi:hypothetical protein